jgi:GGDEF domain-containing protein
MKNKFISIYSTFAILVIIASVILFSVSIFNENQTGKAEAEKSFSWISREIVETSLSNGFMTDSFISNLTDICRKSQLLRAVVINTPSGALFSWPSDNPAILYNADGTARIVGSSLFVQIFSSRLDIGDGSSGSVVITASLDVLPRDAIFIAGRSSFLIILALLLATIVLLVFYIPGKPAVEINKKESPSTPHVSTENKADTSGISLTSAPANEIIDETTFPNDDLSDVARPIETVGERIIDEEDFGEPEIGTVTQTNVEPEGLFSPVTGMGWEQYLAERLDAELVRAASSEQDLTLVILRIAGLLHTDEILKKIASSLLETFRFRDMVFEFGNNGFAGILQNVSLDEAMKTAENLYAGIDSILMDTSFEGQITIGITTRTARLLPASRMIEEASSAARKAEEEPSLPIVAFRANPEKYRDFIVNG